MINKRHRYVLSISTLTLLISFVILGSHTITGAFTNDKDAQDKLYRDYVRGVAIVRENYVEELEYEPLTTAAIQGMLRVLDPHSNFYDRKAFDDMRMEQRSQYYGIGASIQQRYRSVYIIEPFYDTPAARAGVRYGDQIIAIDGQSTDGWSSDKVRDTLRGELGSEVKVTVRRAGSAEPLTVKIERGAVDLPSISASYMARSGIGYVGLTRGFHSTTSDELSSAIANLKGQGMTSLVLDLRENPGGFLDQAIRVADKFLHRGQTIVSVRGRDGRTGDKDWPAESGAPETFPMVVLIDEGTASASEIVAGAIQDHDRGLIVGEPSFGKGLVQTIYPLTGGVGLTLTTARYYTPSGRLIQRDYSNGSSYEYRSRRTANGTQAEPHNDQRRTDTGRPVYGGGGIDPDIKIIPKPMTELQGEIWTTGLFQFVRELMAGDIAAAPGFKRNGPEFNHQPKRDEFIITDEIMKAYREFMVDYVNKNQELGLTMAMIDQNLQWARNKIREEVLLGAYGQDMQKRIMADQDEQLQRAISEMPQAAQLAERARRLTKTSKR
ncbi:MAG: S41 family peptidase [Blastocatellia bacterium]|nr:S41 family peptidase [Blastocatellia bacterium]